MQSRVVHIALLLLLAFLVSCNEHIADSPLGNRPPQTYLWLYPDSTIATTVSRQHLRWWGEDPDGAVRGFLLSFTETAGNVSSLPLPDTLRYTWVTANDSLFLFPLDTLFRRFIVVVRAVDNRFPGVPVQSIIRFKPFAFLDSNDDGIFDADDTQLPNLLEATDPKGAILMFPIRNSPPVVNPVANPLDPTALFSQADTTYTAATFAWTADDPDGKNTLRSYRIALNDTSNPGNWLTIGSLRDSMVTLVVPRSRSDAAGGSVTADVYSGAFLGRQYIGQIPGMILDAPNIFFVEAKDVAGEYSRALTYPSGKDIWYVRKPRAKMLFVRDYIEFDSTLALTTYMQAVAAAGPDFGTVDVLNIDFGLTLNDKGSAAPRPGALVPPFVDPALIYTCLLYDYVFWYTDRYPSLNIAQLALFTYIQNGGRIIFSTSFLNTIDPRGALSDFAPIDSISSIQLVPPPQPPSLCDTRIPANFIVYPDSSDPTNIYPQLAFNPSPANHLIFMRPMYKRADARYIYHLQGDSRGRYIGTPNLGVVDGQGRIVFMGIPLHLLNNTNPAYASPGGLAAFFVKAITTHFSPAQRVNRSIF